MLGFSDLTASTGQKLYNGFFRQGWRRGRLFFIHHQQIFWSFIVLIFMLKSRHGILVVKAGCKCENCSPGGLYCRGFLHLCNKSQSQRLVRERGKSTWKVWSYDRSSMIFATSWEYVPWILIEIDAQGMKQFVGLLATTCSGTARIVLLVWCPISLLSFWQWPLWRWQPNWRLMASWLWSRLRTGGIYSCRNINLHRTIAWAFQSMVLRMFHPWTLLSNGS